MRKISNKIRSREFPEEKKGIVVGVLLGDASLQRRNVKGGACLRFGQSTIHKEYLEHLYEIFKQFCGTGIKTYSKYDPKYNKTYYTMLFQTLIYPYFTELYTILYIDGVKTITPQFAKLIEPISLAYWFMDDGAKISGGYLLHTDGFTLSEVELLIKILREKFGIEGIERIRNEEKGQYAIYIGQNSRDRFINIIKPYLVKEMLYKLHDYHQN